MNCRLLFLIIAATAFLANPCSSFDIGTYLANPFKYETDYSADVIFKSILAIGSNTGKVLFNKDRPSMKIGDEVTLFCMNKNTGQMIQTYINDPEISSKIDFSKKLYTVTHGWIDNANRTWVKELVSDLVEFEDCNACAVDWQNLAQYEYTISALDHVPLVGKYLAEFVQYLVSLGISLDNVILVGHSLGGQISGMCGMHLGGKAGSIIALDPAGPMFTHPIERDISNRLDSSDAQYVQVIHTTNGILGCAIDCGHQDFHPDEGCAAQTACKAPIFTETLSPEIISCSHSQAINYFRYSLNQTNVFTGRRCSSAFLYKTWCCEGNPTDKLGLKSERLAGHFFMTTSFRAPFCPK